MTNPYEPHIWNSLGSPEMATQSVPGLRKSSRYECPGDVIQARTEVRSGIHSAMTECR